MFTATNKYHPSDPRKVNHLEKTILFWKTFYYREIFKDIHFLRRDRNQNRGIPIYGRVRKGI